MLEKNLKYFRLKRNLTRAMLAEKAGLTPMAISHYENGDRKPNMDVLKRLADVLGVKIVDFLNCRNENLAFVHGEFRKSSRLNKTQQECIKEEVEEYFNRFFEAVEILGGEPLPPAPSFQKQILTMDAEKDAMHVRGELAIPSFGPIGNLVELLENRGVLVYFLDDAPEGFAGINGAVNDRPYIAVNKKMSMERMRMTIGHELAHMLFVWPSDMEEKAQEKYATMIAGAFLLPKGDAIMELGHHRSAITYDMYAVCNEYGIAMSALAVRAYTCSIINEHTYRSYFIRNGKRKNEGTAISAFQCPRMFEQLVYRAVSEDEISIQKGAELLRYPFGVVAENCRVVG